MLFQGCHVVAKVFFFYECLSNIIFYITFYFSFIPVNRIDEWLEETREDDREVEVFQKEEALRHSSLGKSEKWVRSFRSKRRQFPGHI